MQYAFPIYSREHLKTAIPRFFQQVSQYRNAHIHCAIGKPRPDLVHELSYFVGRISHRRPTRVLARQHSVTGDRNRMYHRTFWRHSHFTYGVFSIKWGAEAPEQLSEHATKAEALAALAAC